MRKIISKNPLFFALFLPALIDSLITLSGQDPSYWVNHATVNEGSPAFYFLIVSPWFYLLGTALWFVFWYWAVKHLKEPLNLFAMFIFTIGHSWGASTWIRRMFWESDFYQTNNRASIFTDWSLVIIFFALISLNATYCLKIYLDNRNHK